MHSIKTATCLPPAAPHCSYKFLYDALELKLRAKFELRTSIRVANGRTVPQVGQDLRLGVTLGG